MTNEGNLGSTIFFNLRFWSCQFLTQHTQKWHSSLMGLMRMDNHLLLRQGVIVQGQDACNTSLEYCIKCVPSVRIYGICEHQQFVTFSFQSIILYVTVTPATLSAPV